MRCAISAQIKPAGTVVDCREADSGHENHLSFASSLWNLQDVRWESPPCCPVLGLFKLWKASWDYDRSSLLVIISGGNGPVALSAFIKVFHWSQQLFIQPSIFRYLGQRSQKKLSNTIDLYKAKWTNSLVHQMLIQSLTWNTEMCESELTSTQGHDQELVNQRNLVTVDHNSVKGGSKSTTVVPQPANIHPNIRR
jgi:hypothetical protein